MNLTTKDLENLDDPKSRHDKFLEKYEDICRFFGFLITTNQSGDQFVVIENYCDGWQNLTISAHIKKLKSNFDEDSMIANNEKEEE